VYDCEQSTSWQDNNPIDLKPFLVKGRNVIKMKTYVYDEGEGAFQFTFASTACTN
jgi:hypothetical protein